MLHRAKSAAAELLGHSIGSGRIGVDDSNQSCRFTFLGQLLVHASVVMSEGASANHRYMNETVFDQGCGPGGKLPTLDYTLLEFLEQCDLAGMVEPCCTIPLNR